ncbi:MULTISPECIES: DUF6894 family protein [unclassified Sphingomonas]|uniref:DUF6894 family protein n=1 Tax=unclassified Sphingomonas TaxID=196159 RepID=UPI0016079605|nr:MULTISPECIES: hypothetical protein [unclassified Sphingomonas]MBB3348920.1 hypothetical protein [Sphingomonas sp. BK069]MBB3472697.1 hypothetical protein [Sphingomonas sp. BK345]
MQRYFFNVRDGVSHPDTIGQEYRTLADARVAAVRFAADVMRDEVDALLRGQDWRVELVDADNGLVFSVIVATVGTEPVA